MTDIRNDMLEPDHFYHIYNRGINGCRIFKSSENYTFFLSKFSDYVIPVCDVYAYCLMPNHFHFLVKVKSKEDVLNFVGNLSLQNLNKAPHNQGLHSIDSAVSKQFGKFFSSYTQAYNKVYDRHGALLESPFKRKRIDTDFYLKNSIVYIHRNPIDLKVDFETYRFSSFRSILSEGQTLLKRKEAIALFGDLENFKFVHRQAQNDL